MLPQQLLIFLSRDWIVIIDKYTCCEHKVQYYYNHLKMSTEGYCEYRVLRDIEYIENEQSSSFRGKPEKLPYHNMSGLNRQTLDLYLPDNNNMKGSSQLFSMQKSTSSKCKYI